MEIKLIVPDCTKGISTTIIYDDDWSFRIRTKNFIPQDGKTVEIDKGEFADEDKG